MKSNYIAVLMTVHNRKHETLACLKSLFQAKIPENYSIEVFLTNDGCTDGTPEEIRLLYPSVHILNGSGELYWNRGMYIVNVEDFHAKLMVK